MGDGGGGVPTQKLLGAKVLVVVEGERERLLHCERIIRQGGVAVGVPTPAEALPLLQPRNPFQLALFRVDPRRESAASLIRDVRSDHCAIIILLSASQMLAGAMREAFDLRVHDCLHDPQDPTVMDSLTSALHNVRLRTGQLDGARGSRPLPLILGCDAVQRVAVHLALQSGLSETECCIACLLYLRLTNEEIGDYMNISKRTASQHVGAVTAKLGVSKRYDVRDQFHRAACSLGLT